MKDQLKDVNHFHKVFNVGEAPNSPTLLPQKEYLLRYNLAVEENREYLDACLEGDLVDVADALGDRLYILLGTILKHGMQDKIVEVFNEIHDSNMSKLDDEGKPIYRDDGKVLKSKNYQAPYLNDLV